MLQRGQRNRLSIGIFEVEADGTEVQTMGIDTVIGGRLFVTAVCVVFEFHGIHLWVTMSEVKGFLRL